LGGNTRWVLRSAKALDTLLNLFVHAFGPPCRGEGTVQSVIAAGLLPGPASVDVAGILDEPEMKEVTITVASWRDRQINFMMDGDQPVPLMYRLGRDRDDEYTTGLDHVEKEDLIDEIGAALSAGKPCCTTETMVGYVPFHTFAFLEEPLLLGVSFPGWRVALTGEADERHLHDFLQWREKIR
jgi:hypothetical protein